MNIINLSAYKFIRLSEEQIRAWRPIFKEKALACELKGTILLSREGINLFIAGERKQLNSFTAFLTSYPELSDLWFKESVSAYKPFTRMLVRIKNEIIPMGKTDIQPDQQTAPHLAPEIFKQWYDEGKDMIVLDTRNDYEIELGTFEDAMDLNIEHFRDFDNALSLMPEDAKGKPVVTFCTGGIRCEKAAELMKRKGFKEVYQLEGGIINYFEKCGGAHYEGECFVFDKRVALDPNLQETQSKQCYACRTPIPAARLAEDNVCPNCHRAVA